MIEDVVATRGASFGEPGAPVARTELEELLSNVAAWHGGLWEDERLASCGGPAIARARAWVAYRQATLYPYFAWVYTIGRSRLQPQFQPDEVSLTMIRRISAAIEDLDSLGAVGL